MKAVKLALIFLGFVAIIVLAISWKQIFRASNPDSTYIRGNVTSKDDATLLQIPTESEPSITQEEVREMPSAAENDNSEVENSNGSNSRNHEKTVPSTSQDAKAQHLAEKKAIEDRAVALFNSGKYKECEKLCKTEWCLNSYYVDVKTMGKILSSTDKAVQVPLKHDGILDATGKLTEKYRVKSVADFASLKSIIQKY